MKLGLGWVLVFGSLLLASGCYLAGPEIPFDQEKVEVDFLNYSNVAVVIIAAPGGTSFEDAIADHFVQSFAAPTWVSESGDRNSGSLTGFVYENVSGEKDLWCFDQQYWIARSLSGTLYVREGNHENRLHAMTAELLEEQEGPKWHWLDKPGVDGADLEVLAEIDGDECIKVPGLNYSIDEQFVVTSKLQMYP